MQTDRDLHPSLLCLSTRLASNYYFCICVCVHACKCIQSYRCTNAQAISTTPFCCTHPHIQTHKTLKSFRHVHEYNSETEVMTTRSQSNHGRSPCSNPATASQARIRLWKTRMSLCRSYIASCNEGRGQRRYMLQACMHACTHACMHTCTVYP